MLELTKALTFFVLRPILVKLHILTRLIESFPMVFELWRCIEVKLSIPLAHAEGPSKEELRAR